MKDPGFWWELTGKLGAPVFAATLVACLLERQFNLLHIGLLSIGFAMLTISHWREHHWRS